MKKEPLSRSLKGRPFEYEDFYEILFPDVIGTGGAPKRVTSRKRKTMGPMDDQDDQGTPGTAVMNLLADATYGGNNGAMQSPGQQQHPRASASGPPVVGTQQQQQQQQQRPTSAAIPPRSSITSTSALTPPEEAPHAARQRFLAPQEQQQQRQSNGGPPDKRRRTDYLNVQPPPLASASSQNQDGIAALAEALRSARPARPGWSEQALDVFFRDFAEEDMDLQIKIAEKALAADENKAMVFCKMPVVLRKHWVKRLREVHNGHNRT
jgi:hypothetical protein